MVTLAPALTCEFQEEREEEVEGAMTEELGPLSAEVWGEVVRLDRHHLVNTGRHARHQPAQRCSKGLNTHITGQPLTGLIQ